MQKNVGDSELISVQQTHLECPSGYSVTVLYVVIYISPNFLSLQFLMGLDTRPKMVRLRRMSSGAGDSPFNTIL